VTIEKGELATSIKECKKKVKVKFIDLDHAGNDKLLNQLLLSLGCWLMLARRFCVYNAGLKVDVAREILTVIMMSNDENIHLYKRHTVVHRTFCFWQSLCPFLALRLTTVSLDNRFWYKLPVTFSATLILYVSHTHTSLVIVHSNVCCTIVPTIENK